MPHSTGTHFFMPSAQLDLPNLGLAGLVVHGLPHPDAIEWAWKKWKASVGADNGQPLES